MREIYGEQFAGTERFLDSATYGLPSRRQVDALRTALDDWESGTQDTSAFDEAVDASRAAFAELVGASTDSVTIGSTTSALVGLIAAAVPDGGRIAVQRGEFTSVTAPFAAQSARGVTVEQFDPGTLEASVEASAEDSARPFDLVAVSLVQSADGRVLDTERLRRAVAGTHTRVVIDVTQAVGWKKIDLGWADAVVASGYKWLLAPRGTAWMVLAGSFAETLIPHAAGWYSSETPWANTYEHPPLLAADARRFDASPAWHPMLGCGHLRAVAGVIGHAGGRGALRGPGQSRPGGGWDGPSPVQRSRTGRSPESRPQSPTPESAPPCAPAASGSDSTCTTRPPTRTPSSGHCAACGEGRGPRSAASHSKAHDPNTPSDEMVRVVSFDPEVRHSGSSLPSLLVIQIDTHKSSMTAATAPVAVPQTMTDLRVGSSAPFSLSAPMTIIEDDRGPA